MTCEFVPFLSFHQREIHFHRNDSFRFKFTSLFVFSRREETRSFFLQFNLFDLFLSELKRGTLEFETKEKGEDSVPWECCLR